ncbi:MAG TPA: hypothetical protein VIK98_03130 [Limnochordales bacterium]
MTTYRGVNAQGRAVLYYNVWRYECPNGCATATLDFSQASLDPAGLRRVGQVQVRPGPSGEVVVHQPSLLERMDLSFIITVLGLIFGYAMFAWALVVIPASPIGKIVCAVALTLSALYIVVHLTAAPGRGKDQAMPPDAALAGEAAGAGEPQDN